MASTGSMRFTWTKAKYDDYNIIHQSLLHPEHFLWCFCSWWKGESFAFNYPMQKDSWRGLVVIGADNRVTQSQGQHEWEETARPGLNKDIPTCIWVWEVKGTFTLRISAFDKAKENMFFSTSLPTSRHEDESSSTDAQKSDSKASFKWFPTLPIPLILKQWHVNLLPIRTCGQVRVQHFAVLHGCRSKLSNKW